MLTDLEINIGVGYPDARAGGAVLTMIAGKMPQPAII
ncbi:MAG: hypothetical protein RIR52_1313 [Acidobacteriota bacterium]